MMLMILMTLITLEGKWLKDDTPLLVSGVFDDGGEDCGLFQTSAELTPSDGGRKMCSKRRPAPNQ